MINVIDDQLFMSAGSPSAKSVRKNMLSGSHEAMFGEVDGTAGSSGRKSCESGTRRTSVMVLSKYHRMARTGHSRRSSSLPTKAASDGIVHGLFGRKAGFGIRVTVQWPASKLQMTCIGDQGGYLAVAFPRSECELEQCS